MSKTKIEWTDRTWNPVTGCTKVSQGCKNCYAERMYERFNGKGSFKNITCYTNRLQQPLSWKTPSMIFVNSMSDLFHEDVPFEFINAVFSVMADVSIHTYQILTKRPQRMLDFYQWKAQEFGVSWKSSPNVWLGVSVEDQKAADERIPLLLKAPAAVRFLSCEPLLDAIDLKKYMLQTRIGEYPFPKLPYKYRTKWLDNIHWVIVGGESGPKARQMQPNWARSLRDQCNSASVPFFFKQWGEWTPNNFQYPCIYRGINWINGENVNPEIHPNTISMCKVGKKMAGRLLDGIEHNEFPKNQINNIKYENIEAAKKDCR